MQLYTKKISNSFTVKASRFKRWHNAFVVLFVMLNLPAWADIHPRNASLNYAQKALSSTGNPGSAALILERKDPHVMTGGSSSLSSGIEYGDLDELFAAIDELSLLFNPPGEEVPPGEEQPPTPENPDRDYTWDDIFAVYPDLEDRLDLLKTKVITTVSVLGLITAEGYGKAEASGELSAVLSKDLFGGSLVFGASALGNSKALGIFDDIEFDKEVAKEKLREIVDLDINDPIQELDLTGGITLFYNPENNNIKLSIDNDSLLLIKAAKEAQMSFSYSRKALENEYGGLYWGIKPTFYRVGLTNIGTRIGDVSDTEALFDDIHNADFIYKNGYDIDVGLVWAADNYQIGASFNNIIEQDYKFPELDKDRFSSVTILNKLNAHESYTMERQLKLEAGVYTDQRHWSLNAELDANAIQDPMRDEYQWFTLTAGYAADNWWLPSARFGVSRNLVGSKLSYVNAGVTVMKIINLDVATTLDTVTLDGLERRRGLSLSLGIQFNY